jgi:ABC-2 type transport system permease protein
MIGLVARREIMVRGRTKGYRFGLLATVLLVVVLASLPRLLGGGSDYGIGLVGARGGQLQAALAQQDAQQKDLTITLRSYPDEAAARRAIADGQVDAAVVDNTRVVSKTVIDQGLSVVLDTAHRIVTAQENLRAAGLDPATVGRAMQVTPLTEATLNGDGKDAGFRLGLALTLVVILFLLVIQACTMVAMGVVEEKGSRIVEILLTSLRPWQLLAGKTIGMGVLGLIQVLLIAVVGLTAAQVSGAIPELPEGTYGVVASAIVWFLLGYAFYAAMYAAIASLVSRQEDVGGVLTPATMLLMSSYVVGFIAAQNPDGTLSRVLSIVPPFSALVMPVRSAVITVPAWQIGLAMGLMVLAAVAVLFVGGRVYQRAVLRTGARVRLREVLG